MASSSAHEQPEDVDPKSIMQLMDGFRASQALLSAVELGVIDVLDREAGPEGMPLKALAAAVGKKAGSDTPASEDGVRRLLDAITALRLVRQTSSGGFVLTELSRKYVAASSPTSLHGYIVISSKVIYPLFGSLQTAVVKGGNVWQEVMGRPGPEIFKHIYADEGALYRFMHAMHSFASISAPKVVTAFDLSRFKHWVDLGGATGAFMQAAAAAYPHANATVVDLPHVVASVEQNFLKPPFITDPSILQRVKWVPGDFFQGPEGLPKGDIYVMTRILHDWDEESCNKILATVHTLLPPGGALLLGEMLLNEGRDGPVPTTLQSLNMLVQTHGKERTPEEYRTLLERQGFVDVQTKVTGVYLDAILAFKPS